MGLSILVFEGPVYRTGKRPENQSGFFENSKSKTAKDRLKYDRFRPVLTGFTPPHYFPTSRHENKPKFKQIG